jgi:hypothetical protein
MSNKKHSRRDLLKAIGAGAAVASTPMEIFLDGLVDGIVNKAVADEGRSKFKYIMIQNYAAPPRWMFDLFLAPYGGTIVANASVGSELVASGSGANRRYTGTTYKTHDVKGIKAPVIWTHNVGDGSGSARPLSDLMDNMLVLQGIDALNPGHSIAAAMLNRPLTNKSLDGLLADSADLPFGGLGFNTFFQDFKSKTGHTLKRFANNDDVAKILPEAFVTGDIDIHKKYKAEIDRATDKLNRSIATTDLQGEKLEKTLQSTKTLMKSEILKIQRDLPALIKKYETIISKTIDLSKNLPGLSNLPVGATGQSYNVNRTVSAFGDLRDGLNGMEANFLAKKFALVEYVITNNLTASSALNVDAMVYTLKRGASSNAVRTGISSDQHGISTLASVFFTSMFYRVSGACILGLVDGLKATSYGASNMFDYTVIRQSGEFGRHPRDTPNNTGSDHSPWSNSNMIISGMIKGPIIAGQIRSDGASAGYRKGSWGAGGLLKHGVPATTGHVVSTIAAMLEIPSPSENNPSLIVKNSNGEVELNDFYIEKTKVV